MDDRKFRRIAQIAQRTYFVGTVIFMNLFFGSDFSWYLFFLISQKMPGPSPPVMYMSEYTPWATQLGTKKKLVFRVLKRQNLRSFRGFCPPGSPPGYYPGSTGGLTRPPNPQLNFVPQYQLLSDGLESINISFYLFRK